MTRYIYHLTDAAGRVVYVGCSHKPENRPAQQLRDAMMRRSFPGEPSNVYYRWLLSEHEAERQPRVLRVREAIPGDWRSDERAEIRSMLAAGHRLLNTHRGLSVYDCAPKPADLLK